MRLAVLLLFVAWAAGYPATAQESCEASVTGRTGEVMVAVNGADTLVSWVVEPKAGVGHETPHFSRPGLLFDFDLRPTGLVVSGMLSTITRISDHDRGQAPALSQVRMRAAGVGAPIEWPAEHPEKGENELVARLQATWPAAIELYVLVGSAIVASATFELSALPEAERMAREALATCARQ